MTRAEARDVDAHWLGIDLGGTKTSGVVVDAAGAVVARSVVPSRRLDGPRIGLDLTAALARDLIERTGGVAAAGVGFAGLVDVPAGRVSSSVILPGWDDFPLANELAARLGVPVRLDNDAHCAGLGEHAALGSPREQLLMVVTVGTGIGAALILNGELLRGAQGVAAELGHTTIDPAGLPCWCGNTGCLHTLASGSAMAERAARFAREAGVGPLASLEDPSLETVHAAALRGDASALRALEQGATALGLGLANAVQLLNPHRISLCGGVLALGEPFLTGVRTELRRRTFREAHEKLVVEPAAAGPDAGALGAALLARHGGGR